MTRCLVKTCQKFFYTKELLHWNMIEKFTTNNVTIDYDRKINSLLALYPSGIPKREPPSCEAPRQPTIYFLVMLTM